MKLKRINRSELSTMRMLLGNEKKYPKVIDSGMVKEWTGISWIETRKATAYDYAKLPVVKRAK